MTGPVSETIVAISVFAAIVDSDVFGVPPPQAVKMMDIANSPAAKFFHIVVPLLFLP